MKYLPLLLLFLSSYLSAQTYEPLDKITPHGDYTYAFRNTETGEIAQNHRDQVHFPPASVMKSVTTMIALEKLGEDYRYTSTLGYNGDIVGDELKGDLIYDSNGDPTIASQYFDEYGYQEYLDLLVQKLLDHGIRQITGDVVVNDIYFSGHEQGPDWLYRDLGNYYAAGVWSVNIHDNLFLADFKMGAKVGSETRLVKTFPPLEGYLDIRNEILTGPKKSGDQSYFFGDAYSNRYTARGTLPIDKKSYTIKGSLPDAPRFFLKELYKCLEEKHIKVQGDPVLNYDKNRYKIQNTLFTYESPTLFDIATVCNEKSVNFFADAMIRSLGESDVYHGQGSLEKGIEAELLYLKQSGLSIESWEIKDGSGLSPDNKIHMEGLTLLFDYAKRHHKTYEFFKESLAEAGKEGTIKNLINGHPELQGKVYAKSGTITGVVALAGYLTASSGKEYSFGISVRNFDGSYGNARSKIADLLSDFYKSH